MDISGLSIQDRAILENLAHEDHLSVDGWLAWAGITALNDAGLTSLHTIDTARHVYDGPNVLDKGRRINCQRPGCKELRDEGTRLPQTPKPPLIPC